MSDIQHLIELLKSDNPNKRYDACEELRVSRQPLPQDAIDALRFATNDSNPEVADAAQRALALHTSPPEAVSSIKQEETIINTVKSWWLIGLLAGLIPGLILYIWIVLIVDNEIFYPICLGFPGIPCGMVGAFLGRKSKTTAWIGAILGAILGVGLWFGFAMATCLLCM